MTSQFSSLGLSEPFLRAVAASGYELATPIQAKAIPVILTGRDLIGCAQTGTGKTAAFALPLMDRLLQTRPQRTESTSEQTPAPKGSRPKPRKIRALVLSPTRELTAQIGASFAEYGQFTPLRHAVIFGGVSQQPQVKALKHGVDALVATPGRLIDLMQQGFVDLSNVEFLVFDEADQMLDMGFLPDLKRIVAAVPVKRQTLMFSATMPAEIRQLAQMWLRNPSSVETVPVGTPAERIAQSVYFVEKKQKSELLAVLLKSVPRGRTIVFSRTKHGADKIVRHLSRSGVRAEAIHGNKSQGARTRALDKFKGKNPPVLVATDIAARGLDIDDISHVFNFDLPEVPDTYVHRIGRTARAGAEGAAVSFCSTDEHLLLRQIEKLTRLKISVATKGEGAHLLTPAPLDGPLAPVSRAPRTGRAAGGTGAATRRVRGKQGGQPAPSPSGGARRRRRTRNNGSTAPAPAPAGNGSDAGHGAAKRPAAAQKPKTPRQRRRRAL